MNKNLFRNALCACGVVAAGLTTFAGPLQRADVAAEPTLVLHVDCDTLRTSAIGQWLLSEMDKPEAQAKFAALQIMFNFDPRKQLHGLTRSEERRVGEECRSRW